MLPTPKRKAEEENKAEQQVGQAAPRLRTEDEVLLRYENLLTTYQESNTRYLADLQDYYVSYETTYEILYAEIRAGEVKKVHNKMAPSLAKIEEEKKNQSEEKILQAKLDFKKKHLAQMLPKADQHSYKTALTRMEDALPVLKQISKKGIAYLIAVKFNQTYMTVVSIAAKVKPSGWKVHISVAPTLDNLKKAWDIFRLIFLRHALSHVKVANYERGNKIEPGKEITLYQSLDIERGVEWKPILMSIESDFKQQGILPSTSLAYGDKQIRGSQYLSYRNDFCPESKKTLRLKKLVHVIDQIAKELKEGKAEKVILRSIEVGLKEMGINTSVAREEFGPPLVEGVKGLLQTSGRADLSALYYNPFGMQGDPNQAIDLRIVLEGGPGIK